MKYYLSVLEGMAIMSGSYKWADVWAEVIELVEAIISLNWTGVKEEMSDLLFTLQMKVYLDLGWHSACIRGGWLTYQKGLERMREWRRIFFNAGLAFSPIYLIHGSNWMKPEKVEKALQLAREDQGFGEATTCPSGTENPTIPSTEILPLGHRPMTDEEWESSWDNDLWLDSFMVRQEVADSLAYLEEESESFLEMDQWRCEDWDIDVMLAYRIYIESHLALEGKSSCLEAAKQKCYAYQTWANRIWLQMWEDGKPSNYFWTLEKGWNWGEVS